MKNVKNFLKLVAFSLAIFGFLLLSFDSKEEKAALSLLSTSIDRPIFSQEGIEIQAKAYNSEECKLYLKRDLLARGYQPIQVTLHNNTPKSYLLSDQAVNLKLVSPKRIVGRLMKSTIPRMVGYKVASFFFWPFAIPGTVDSIKTFKTKLRLRKDFFAKSLKAQAEVIPAYSSVHRVIFIRHSESLTHFNLQLIEQESGYIKEFNIEI